MNIDQNSLIILAIILSVTLIGVVALIRNTSATLRVDLGGGKSFIFEGDKPLSMPQKKVDCLPNQENRQHCQK
ncbi:MAG: hypothetical protein AAGE84_01615 [Cyanobacteria bacterium P01_G01_bin.39]